MTEQPSSGESERIEALVAAVRAIHGERLDDTQIELLRQHAERLRHAATLLAGFPLGNGDEPDTTFAAIDRVDRA